MSTKRYFEKAGQISVGHDIGESVRESTGRSPLLALCCTAAGVAARVLCNKETGDAIGTVMGKTAYHLRKK